MNLLKSLQNQSAYRSVINQSKPKSNFKLLKSSLRLFFLVLLFTTTYFPQNLELANNYYKKYDYDNALKYFLKAETNKETGYQQAFYEIANCFKNVKKYSEAIQYLNKALKTPSKTYNKYLIYWLYAECYYKLNHLSSMSKYFHLAQKTSPVPDYTPKAYRFLLDGYEYITTSDIEDIYLKTNSLKQRGNIIKVWLKYYWDGVTIHREDELKLASLVDHNIELYWKKRNKAVLDIKNKRYNMKYYLQYVEIDSKNNLYNVLMVYKYDDKGNVIKYHDFSDVNSILPNKGWTTILPNSVMGKIFEYIRQR